MSNLLQAQHSQIGFDHDLALPFGTGTSAGGYKLTGLDIALTRSGAAPAHTVTIRSNTAGSPGTILGTLTTPTLSSGSHVARYAAPAGGIDLDPSTAYWVMVDVTGTPSTNVLVGRTTSDAEDAGGASGWTIDNTLRHRGAASTGGWTEHTDIPKLAIHGYAKGSRPGFVAAGGLVSNTGQPQAAQSLSIGSRAQAFTTGPNAGGYRLTHARIVMRLTLGTLEYAVRVRADAAGSQGGVLGTLGNPAGLPTGSNAFARFDAPGDGLDLEPNTTYWLEFEGISASPVFAGAFGSTESTSEDAGAAAGWRIANSSQFRTQDGWSTTQLSLRIAIHGEKRADPPSVPAAPTLTKRDGTTLTVTWAPPENTGPAVTGYDVRYRRKGDAAWIDHPHDGDLPRAAILRLLQGASWEAQVRARNAVGASAWSPTGAGHTGPARFVRAEIGFAQGVWKEVNIIFTRDLGSPAVRTRYTVMANGASRNVLASGYGHQGALNEAWLAVGTADRFQAGDTITVSYDGSDSISGTKHVDVDHQVVESFTNKPVTNLVPAAAVAPAKPSAPTVAVVSGRRALTVGWTAPDDSGSAITDYDLRYFKGSADPNTEAEWIEAGESGGLDHAGTALSAVLTGLDASSAYRVQVRASNAGGAGPWSDSGTASTGTGATAPAAPATPTVATVANSSNLTVTWTAPSNGGGAITDYDLRYYQGMADPANESEWVTEDASSSLSRTASTALTRTISGLAPTKPYRVQVRAGNANGEGPWSASGTATTNAATGTNHPPQRLQLSTQTGVFACEEVIANRFETVSAVAGEVTSTGSLVGTAGCGNVLARKAPMFSDPDGDNTLTFTAWVHNLPANVVLAQGPVVNAGSSGPGRWGTGTVSIFPAAALQQTDVEIRVRATDPHGASVERDTIFQVGTFSGTTTPSLPAVAPASRHFAVGAPIAPFTLPAATGGDVTVTGAATITFPHFYAVTGLPPGLSFDPATRTVSGTPTAAGAYKVTYTADDADDAWAGKTGATASDIADTASRTFTVEVGMRPKIHRVRVVSQPSYDADGDGLADTYVRGDKILVDVEFGGNMPVAIGGAEKRVRLRLAVGNNLRTPENPTLLYHNETLRFAYTVVPADRDTDGVQVQTAGAEKRVLFLVGATTLTHLETGVAADLTFGDALPVNARAKVDGSKTAADIGPRPTGATLTVTFDGALDTTLDADDVQALREALQVVNPGFNDHLRGHRQHPRTVAVAGSTVTLTLGVPITAGEQNVRVGYAPAAGQAPLRAAAAPHRAAPGFRGLVATNATPGTEGPAPLYGEVTGRTLKLVFDGELDASSAPAGSAFRVDARDGDEDVRYIDGTGTASIDGRLVTVTLARAVRTDESVDVSYTKPASSPLQDAAGAAVASFRNFRAVGVRDAVAPALAAAAVMQTGTSPAKSKLALYFDEPLDAASKPAAGDFAVRVGETATTVSAVAVAANAVMLTLDRLAAAGTVFEVTYTPGASPIRDVDGNPAAAFRQTVTAEAVAGAVLQSAVVDGGYLTLTYDRALEPDPQFPAAPRGFVFHHPAKTVTLDGRQVTYEAREHAGLAADVVAVAIRGRAAVLELAGPVFPCDGTTPYTVRYGPPSPLRLPFQVLGQTLHHTEPLQDQAVTNARAGWCELGWFDSARTGSVIVRSKRPFATDVPPEPAWFAVTASGGPVTVTAAAFSAEDAHELRLSLDRDLAPEETVTVGYTRPGGAHGLYDATGRQLADLADARVKQGAAEPARLAGAATEEKGRGLLLTFTKAIAIAGLHRDYTVLVDGARRATTQVFWGGREVGLLLAEPVRFGETVTVAYAPPASGTRLHGADRRPVAGFGPVAVENTVARAANTPATGAPAIEGAAEVGATLAASTEGIADANGLAGAAWTYQWIAGDADIAGATGARLALSEALAGHAIRVRVSFTDDDGYRETLVSAATAAVALRPLTAEFVDVPAEHDGKRLFRFELRFSEDFPGRFDYRILRDRALEVTNGTVREAKRIAGGRNDRWTIAVRPASHEDVTVTLPEGSVETEAGRRLANTVSATVRGPAALSVADAGATEGADEAVAFAVSLSRAAPGTVTVDYATRDGTAVAGEDYTFTRGTLAFAPGELEKTVSVPLLDDAIDEGSETFTLKLMNARGAAIADGEAVGTIENSDPLQKMWLSRFGRTVAGHVTAAVSDRLANPLTGAQVTVGGQRVDLAGPGDAALLGQTLNSIAGLLGAPSGPGGDGSGPPVPASGPGGQAGAGGWPGAPEPPVRSSAPGRMPTGRDLLLGSAFHLAAEGDGAGPGFAAWGRVTAGGFDGEAPAEVGKVRIDGNVATGTLGADAEWDRLLAGVAVSVSEGDGTFDQPGVDRGTVESGMTAVSPYARLRVNDRLSVWGLAGFGSGDMTIVQDARAATDTQTRRDRIVTRTDIGMRLAALGGRGALMQADGDGGIDLALKADAFLVETEWDAVSGETDRTAGASRLRLILEGGRSFEMDGGAVLAPSLEFGLRHDGGDAETGTGIELGGGVSWADPGARLSVEARARMLAAHADAGYEEWGVSGAVRLAPGARGRGLSFSLSPVLGAAGSGTERLWGARDAGGLGSGGAFRAQRGLQGELGYGLPALGGRFTGTPGLGLGLADGGARDYRIGWRLVPAAPGAPGFEIGLDATRREPAGAPPEHGIALRAAIRW